MKGRPPKPPKLVRPITLDNDETASNYKIVDPKNVNGRLYDAMSTLLDHFNSMTVREQVATVAAIARIQVLFIKLREEVDAPKPDTITGTTVRQYEKAFKANADRRGKGIAGSDLAGLLTDDGNGELEY